MIIGKIGSKILNAILIFIAIQFLITLIITTYNIRTLEKSTLIFTSDEKMILDGIVNSITEVYVFMLILVIIATMLITRSITKPITELTNSVKKISSGNLNIKINIKSKDEIGELAEAFNQMNDDIKKSREEIEKYSKSLEEKVKERTSELDKKVSELTDTKTAMLNMMEDLDNTNKELINVQIKLKKNLGEIRKLDVEKDRFISITAHELKTPMTTIHGFAQLLENKNIFENTEARNKYLKIIESETKRLSKLVTEVLDLSRADLNTLSLNIEDVNLTDVLNEIKEEMKSKAGSKNLYLNFKLEENLPQIETDKEKFKEIFINLIDNAIKYTPRGYIKVQAFKEGNHVKFSVTDTGVGIPKKYFKNIFERFFQVESPYTRKVGGTGLGLSICKEFIESLEGNIWFKSKEGKGTTFYFTLPLKVKFKKVNIL